MIKPRQHKSINDDTRSGKPRVKLGNNRQVVANNVMANNSLSVFESLYASRKRFTGPTFIVVTNRLVSLCIIDNQTVDASNIVE